jgi:NADH dehydrogenase
VGAGFAGLYAARALARKQVSVTVIDKTNHHCFQPLLYQVATATLAATDIATPIRWLLREQRNTEVILGEVVAVDPGARSITLASGAKVEYDYLILAPGSRPSYFGHDKWEERAPGLKSIADALEIRGRFLTAFERAEAAGTTGDSGPWLTFVVIGGGPTGVELAGMIPTVASHGLPREFRHIDTSASRVILLEGGPRLLPTLPEDLSAKAKAQLEELGVEVRLNARVTDVGEDYVAIGDERIASRTIFWAAGNSSSPLGGQLGAPVDKHGRVKVEPDLSVPGHPEIFVAGDLAAMTSNGQPVPGVAPAAMQSGPHAALNVIRLIHGRETVAFRYHDKGDLATIGRYRAVARIGKTHLSGWPAWWTWLLVHITYLAGFRNRLSVLLEWGYAFFTSERGARLITSVKDGRQRPGSGGA